MGTGFLMDIDIFHGYGFGTVKPSGFVPVAISSWEYTVNRKSLYPYGAEDEHDQKSKLLASLGSLACHIHPWSWRHNPWTPAKQRNISHLYLSMKSARVMDQEISHPKVYLTQSITTDLLGYPSVIKGTPIVDTKGLSAN
jgi:hypothetical protein